MDNDIRGHVKMWSVHGNHLEFRYMDNDICDHVKMWSVHGNHLEFRLLHYYAFLDGSLGLDEGLF